MLYSIHGLRFLEIVAGGSPLRDHNGWSPGISPLTLHAHTHTHNGQVTVEYKRDPQCQGALIPKRVHTILISTQHDPDVTNEQIHKVRVTD